MQIIKYKKKEYLNSKSINGSNRLCRKKVWNKLTVFTIGAFYLDKQTF